MLVVDSGPLSHFAQAGWLKILEAIAGERRVVIPELVRVEIAAATHQYPFLSQVLDAQWIAVDRSDDIRLLVTQARYEARLVSGDKNRGECGVLVLCL